MRIAGAREQQRRLMAWLENPAYFRPRQGRSEALHRLRHRVGLDMSPGGFTALRRMSPRFRDAYLRESALNRFQYLHLK